MAQVQQYQLIKPEQVRTGMEIRVHQRISEQTAKGLKERIQVFDGLVLTMRGMGVSRTMTVRKVSDGVGVERIYPLALPTIEKIELVKQLKVARKNISFLKHAKKRMKEVKPKLRAVAVKETPKAIAEESPSVPMDIGTTGDEEKVEAAAE